MTAETKLPAPPEERCVHPLGDLPCNVRRSRHLDYDRHHAFTAPAPPAAPKAVLTREGVGVLLDALQISMLYTGKKHARNREDARAKLLAHDAALRERVEELEGLVAQEERAADVVNACRIESDARVERLEGLLRVTEKALWIAAWHHDTDENGHQLPIEAVTCEGGHAAHVQRYMDDARKALARDQGQAMGAEAMTADKKRKAKKKSVTVGIYRCPMHPEFYAVVIDDTRITPSKCCGRWDLVREWKNVEAT